jgi:hypothetical protein
VLIRHRSLRIGLATRRIPCARPLVLRGAHRLAITSPGFSNCAAVIQLIFTQSGQCCGQRFRVAPAVALMLKTRGTPPPAAALSNSWTRFMNASGKSGA